MLVRLGVPVFALACVLALWCVPTTTVFTASARKPVDLVLIVDDSGSMKEEQAGLSDHLASMLTGLRDNVGVRVAVTTTTMLTPPRPLQFLAPDDPALAQAIRVGVGGGASEQGLQVMLQTLESASGASKNEDSFRAGTALAFVVISDEDDDSPLDVSTFVHSVSRFRTAWQAPVVLSVVTVLTSDRHREAVQALGGRVLDLDGHWGRAVTAIADDLGTMSTRFTLPSRALGRVVVDVDGFRLDGSQVRMAADGRTVVLDVPLREGATVAVTAMLPGRML